MTANQEKWPEQEVIPPYRSVEDGMTQSSTVEKWVVDVIEVRSRSRFKEEVLKALEGMKKCQPGAWGENECAACREGFKEDCTTNAIQEAIETIKKL